MAVTITPSANSALSSELLLSGTLLIENAKDDGTETLSVSVYNKNTGATFTGTAQVYDTSKTTLTYAYANGTNFSVNLGTGDWVYQRLSTEVGNTVYTYIITFAWTDSDGNISKTLTVETRENIVINAFTANPLDDLDEAITGTIDVDIVNVSGISVSSTVTTNGTSVAGVPKAMSTTADRFEWSFVDGTALVVDLGEKIFSYTRNPQSIGDKTVDSYVISLNIGAATATVSTISAIGFSPEIKSFSANKAVDTDLKLGGFISVTNATGSNIAVNMTHNGIAYKCDNKVYSNSLSFDFLDGSSIDINFSNNSWEYHRLAEDTQDLTTDTYSFELLANNKYGSDSAKITVQTTVPKATIISFSADNIPDSDKRISGTFKYELPSIANNPSISIDVAVNGVLYQGNRVEITGEPISFEYANGSTMIINNTSNTFTYMRSSDDYNNADEDIYSFECSIIVNGETVSQNLTVKSMAGQRFYDYEPAYPVNIQPGSVETQRTAWGKSVEETKRIYRLINENLNYYESIAMQLKDELEKFKAYMASLSFMPKGTILIWDASVADIPKGWAICDGNNNTPNTINKFLRGAATAGEYRQAGLPNLTGAFNLSGIDWGAWANGAFYLSSGWQYEHPSGKGTTNSTINFDASRINPIFGRSNTVEPDSYSVCFIKKVSD